MGSVGAEEQQVCLFKDGGRRHGAGAGEAAHARDDRGVGNDQVGNVDGFLRVALVVHDLDDVVGAVLLVILLEGQLSAAGKGLAVLHLVARHGKEERQLVLFGTGGLTGGAALACGAGLTGGRTAGGGIAAAAGQHCQRHRGCQRAARHFQKLLTFHVICLLFT